MAPRLCLALTLLLQLGGAPKKRPQPASLSTPGLPYTPCRHATLLRRPLRPYTFTQLITLSDGSVTVTRTTSPQPVYRSAKDTRNHPLWNPSSQKLAGREEDEAGRLRAFRKRFGRGWDAEATSSSEDAEEGDAAEEDASDGDAQSEDGLMDLISGFQSAAAEQQQQQQQVPGVTTDGQTQAVGENKS